MSLISYLKKQFGANERAIRHYQKEVSKINSIDFSAKSNEEIKNTALNANNRTVVFAAIKEAVKRTMGLNTYDVQLIGGLTLSDNHIAEMKTGEGKTLVTAYPAIYKALSGKKVFVVTVNSYLSQRDYETLKPVYDFFDLNIALNDDTSNKELDYEYKKSVYQSSIIYTTNKELVFDYLRSNTVKKEEDFFLDEDNMDYVIIDEADSVLIDDARSPLILSQKAESTLEDIYFAKDIADNVLQRSDVDQTVHLNQFIEIANLSNLENNTKAEINGDYFYDEGTNHINLFETAYKKIEDYLIAKKLIKNSHDLYSEQIYYIHLINNAITAKFGYRKDHEYVLMENKVVIIDQSTGRLLHNSRWKNGLHQAIECKENIEVREEDVTLAQITYQNFFNLFKEKSGMTGTAYTEASELAQIYGLNTIIIPPNKPLKRIDLEDRMFISVKDKYKYLVKLVKDSHNKGQPILIGTPSVEISEQVSEILTQNNFSFNLLNAKNHAKEAEIIQNAGKLGAITISTNMAGRGTDIMLGGYMSSQAEKEKVLNAGGLFVIGVGKNHSRRIDNQLIGRAGRQGEKGKSIFLVSLEDELIVHNSKPELIAYAKKFFSKFGDLTSDGIETAFSSWRSTMEKAQQKVEHYYYANRKSTYQYDSLVNEQRKAFYKYRKHILKTNNEEIEHFFYVNLQKYIESEYYDLKDEQLSLIDNENYKHDLLQVIQKVSLRFENEIHLELIEQAKNIELKDDLDEDEIFKIYTDLLFDAYQKRWRKIEVIEGQETKFNFIRLTVIETADKIWSNYIENLDTLKQSSQLSVYAQKNPLSEFKTRSHNLFLKLFDEISLLSVQKILSENMSVDLVDINNLADYEFSKELEEMTGEELEAELRLLTDKLLKTELLLLDEKIEQAKNKK